MRCILSFFALMFALAAPVPALAIDVTPSDNFNILTGVVADLQAIRRVRQVTAPVSMPMRDSSATPTDVYEQVHTLAAKLLELRNKLTNAPLSHTTALDRLERRAIPADVHELLKHVQAMAIEIRRLEAVPAEDGEAFAQFGKTPTEVYRLAVKAVALADSLL